jgi:hypothetical protein
MFWPRMSSSPTPESSTSNRSTSTTGAVKPTVSGRASQYSWGRNVDTDEVSVSPKPFPRRALGNEVRRRAITSGAVGAPP